MKKKSCHRIPANRHTPAINSSVWLFLTKKRLKSERCCLAACGSISSGTVIGLTAGASGAAFIDNCNALRHVRDQGGTIGAAVGQVSTREETEARTGGGGSRMHIAYSLFAVVFRNGH